MANIKNELNQIKNAVYGKDVRGSIHDGIDKINKETEKATQKSNEAIDITKNLLDGSFDASAINANFEQRLDNEIRNLQPEWTGFKDDVTSQLAETNLQLSYTPSATELLNEFFRKVRFGESVKIVCMGDSLTYGYDIESLDKRPPDPNPTPNGSVHIRERASITYPEALERFLNTVYDNKVTVINRGYSGDTTQSSYPRWNENPNSDVTMIMFGSNDSRLDVGVENFLMWYRKIIEREISWGSGVILLTPPRRRKDDIRNAVYGNAIYQLGEEYGCPVVDMSEMTSNISADSFSDSSHFNGSGYNYIGARLSSIFIGGGIVNPVKVNNGQSLSAREYVDGIKYVSNSFIASTSGYPTPDEDVPGSGLAALLNEGGKVIYSFYTEVDDLLIYPSMYFSSDSPVKFTLDFGLKSQAVSNYYMFGEGADANDRHVPTTVEYTISDANWRPSRNVFYIQGVGSLEDKKIHVPRKGWHTLTIEGEGVRIHALDFITYRDMRTVVNTNVEDRPNHVELNLMNGWENLGATKLTFTKRGSFGVLEGWITKSVIDKEVITKLPTTTRYDQNHFISVGTTTVNQATLPVLRVKPNGEILLVNTGNITTNVLVINIIIPLL